MKKIIIIIAAILALSDFATAQKYYNKVKLTTTEDSVSYSIGFLMAKNFVDQGWDFIKTDALAKAFSDVLNNKTLAIEEDKLKDILNTYMEKVENEEIENVELIDGTIFDSSFDNEEPVEFNVDGLIPGMTEALKLMSEGSEYIIYIPSDLGYGSYSPAEIIPAYSTLIFDLELIQVIDRIKDDDDIDLDFDFEDE